MSLGYNQILNNNKKYLFWLAYIMYLAELLFFPSMIGEINFLKIGFAIVRNISYALICLKILVDFFFGGYSKKEILINIIGTFFLLILAKITGNKSILIYWIFIVAAHDIELEKIIRVAIGVHLCCMVAIIGCSVFGIIEDRIYMQGVDRARAGLGYQYTTDSSNYFFHIILMYIYLKREKISWESIGILGICNLIFFRLTDTKSAFIWGGLALGAALLLKTFAGLKKTNRIYNWGVVLSVPTLACIMISLSFNFNKQVGWMVKLNNVINGRLELGYNAYKTYGVHLLGQNIQWVGGNSVFLGTQEFYNYVDSSYVQILLNYGIIFFLIICILFIVLTMKARKKNDIYLMLILTVLALHSALDPQLLWMAYNPFIMCYFYIHK